MQSRINWVVLWVTSWLVLVGCGDVAGNAEPFSPADTVRCVSKEPVPVPSADLSALGVDMDRWQALGSERVAQGTWFDGTDAFVTVSVDLQADAIRWVQRVPAGEDAPRDDAEDGCPDSVIVLGTWHVAEDASGLAIDGPIDARHSVAHAPYLSIVAPFDPWPTEIPRPDSVGLSPTIAMSVEAERTSLRVSSADPQAAEGDRNGLVWLSASTAE